MQKCGCLRDCQFLCSCPLFTSNFQLAEVDCNTCCNTAEERARREQTNAAQSNKASGAACRVQEDAQRIYGHLCEIPIQAYREAGAAFSRNDFVTSKRDVDRASDACDARGIAHDIDTQWGAIPRGAGAYSESNHYYGSGEYDYY
jgi:hypothetical protein